MDEATKTQIIDNLVEILLEICPEYSSVPKYGGTMIEVIAGDPKTQVSGYFAYKAHISLEFSEGASLLDPQNQLEGSGKFRRHIKLRSVDDISNKDCKGFLQQAIAQVA
ncbi:DUF1801 domain-containing protein [Lentilitoribacter sp. Alg239-R112]|uniref:DUF1801 domain-containing protein n=1 Tax=Lentilitoribacter sp. Alg239-R112 TaxID=2305987 RepID=UPI0013A6E499|nr:DUF1801 domain-containing protein [Lentilitoribacter sp. Alg239-R112]